MKNSMENLKTLLQRRLLIPVIALAMIVGVGTYEFAKPMPARAEVAAR